MNEKFEKLGFYPADILLPKEQDMTKWAVVACDQFTSEPDYWRSVENTVGEAPSTLRLILPEANLKAPNVDEIIAGINASMEKYMADGVFETLTDSLIYIERQQSDGKIRHGLVGMVDLDAYDFTPGSGGENEDKDEAHRVEQELALVTQEMRRLTQAVRFAHGEHQGICCAIGEVDGKDE